MVPDWICEHWLLDIQKAAYLGTNIVEFGQEIFYDFLCDGDQFRQ